MTKIKNVQFYDIGDNVIYDTGVIQAVCSRQQYEDFKEGKIEKHELYEYSPKDN